MRRLVPLAALSLAATVSFVSLSSLAGAASTSTQSRGEALVASALTATKGAKSFSVHGVSTSTTAKVVIDLTAGPQDAYGVLTYSGQSTQIRRVGTKVYVKSTKGYLLNQGASASQAAVEANKWFQIPSSESSSYKSLMQFLSVSAILSGLAPPSSKGTVTSVKNTTFQGQKAYVVSGTFDSQQGSFTIAAKGKPYLLQIVDAQTSSGGGTVTLSNYNKPVHTTVPKGAVTQ
ncbi:MAG TPA: hypothetical protein VGF87_03555 [Acidimicrobiales bacterium]|jgi:hypothetical protein